MEPLGWSGNGWRDFSEDGGRDRDCAKQCWQQLQVAYRGESNERTGVRDRRHSKRLACVDLSTQLVAVELKVGDSAF